MHSLDLLLTLTGCLIAALILGYGTHRIGLSPIVGYLLAGLAVGPHTPGFAANHDIAEQAAEIGVILLMFGVGMHFHLKELWAVRHVALPGALVQSFAATLLGAIMTHFFHWEWKAGILFGVAISVASTVVLVRVLTDNRDLHTRTGHIAVGWLVVEDLFTVLVLVLLPSLYGSGEATPHGIALSIGIAFLKIAILIALIFLLGNWLLPRLLEQVAATRSRELFTLSVLAIALGIALGSAKIFGVSMALGAFLAGMVVGRSEFSLRAASDALPMRDAFAVLFFVSIGMLMDPVAILQEPGIFLGTLAIILIGKPAIALLIVLFLGYPFRIALSVAAALAQIGEFSFMLALVGIQLHVLPGSAMNTLVAAAIVSITASPIIYRTINPITNWVTHHPLLLSLTHPKHKSSAFPKTDAPEKTTLDPIYRAIVVGYGPVGQTVVRILQENQITPTIIELNLNTVRRLRLDGYSAVYGDATHPATLESADVRTADSLVLTATAHEGSEETIRAARELNPDIHVLARSTYLHEIPKIRQAGAEEVFSGEGETALALTEVILRRLGASSEQIERERARVHDELLR